MKARESAPSSSAGRWRMGVDLKSAERKKARFYEAAVRGRQKGKRETTEEEKKRMKMHASGITEDGISYLRKNSFRSRWRWHATRRGVCSYGETVLKKGAGVVASN